MTGPDTPDPTPESVAQTFVKSYGQNKPATFQEMEKLLQSAKDPYAIGKQIQDDVRRIALKEKYNKPYLIIEDVGIVITTIIGRLQELNQ